MDVLDFYRETDLDVSIALNYPKGMLKVLESVEELLISTGKLIVHHDEFTLDDARKLARDENSLSVKTYHVLVTPNPKVWDILKEPINRDQVKVLAVFHGLFPDNLPSNILRLDLGKSLRKKVSKTTKAAISEAIDKTGTYPKGIPPMEVYEGLLSLCYEVVYSPEYRIFHRSVADKVPLGEAFDFMFNAPSPLTDPVVTNITHTFFEKIVE